ncbi:hypothetical protein [Streptomyces sp. NPDC001153]
MGAADAFPEGDLGEVCGAAGCADLWLNCCRRQSTQSGMGPSTRQRWNDLGKESEHPRVGGEDVELVVLPGPRCQQVRTPVQVLSGLPRVLLEHVTV